MHMLPPGMPDLDLDIEAAGVGHSLIAFLSHTNIFTHTILSTSHHYHIDTHHHIHAHYPKHLTSLVCEM